MKTKINMKQSLAKGILLLLIGMFLISNGFFGVAEELGCEAEWFQAKRILMHTPGEELFLGVTHPESALFEDTFNLEKAAQEHREFITRLNRVGIKVNTVCEVLLKGTENPQGIERKELIDLARQAMILDVSRLSPQEQIEQKKKHEETLKKMAPETLVRIILQRPVVKLRKIDNDIALQRRFATKSYKIVADYELKPTMNLYFLRDQMITTKKGVLLGNLKLPQRQWEKTIIRLVLKKMNINPIYEVQKGTLEGGDFLPAGECAYIGQGIRTDAVAIEELIRNNVFGTKEVVVVKDQWHQQQEMHLDTYFNIISENLVVMVEDRFNRQNPKKRLFADVYEWKEEKGGYYLRDREVDFVDFLLKRKIRIIPVSVSDQEKYGINFLTLKSNIIAGIDGVSERYKQMLKNAQVVAFWLDFTNLKLGYGAAHCTTQVLFREKN